MARFTGAAPRPDALQCNRGPAFPRGHSRVLTAEAHILRRFKLPLGLPLAESHWLLVQFSYAYAELKGVKSYVTSCCFRIANTSKEMTLGDGNLVQHQPLYILNLHQTIL
ncbi:hypothetical protein E2C01_004029 [Portunus trituberculatus]|uniref:Uncharacterized protein n=1 Tax=Portunus trituberculatus TaxID=210409 RepID=A0A5B7CQF8_PORTR|nr:hypothetical protein [Portunus trituberculatus]